MFTISPVFGSSTRECAFPGHRRATCFVNALHHRSFYRVARLSQVISTRMFRRRTLQHGNIVTPWRKEFLPLTINVYSRVAEKTLPASVSLSEKMVE